MREASNLSISVHNLSFKYRDTEAPVLRNHTFSIEKGKMVLLLGPSGSGKSTLALCLNGIIPNIIEGEMEGEVMVAGIKTAESPVGELTRQVGIVFQDPESQFCMLTVEDEVAFGLENLNVPPQEMDSRIEEALARVGMKELRKSRLDRLSGGMKQRLALAAILAMDPEILILDEPTSSLDPLATLEFIFTLKGLRHERTILIIEHKLDHLIELVDEVMILRPDGTIMAKGEPRKVFAQCAPVLDDYGIWVPQVTELASRLMGMEELRGDLPLTVEEMSRVLIESGLAERISSVYEEALSHAPFYHEPALEVGPARASAKEWGKASTPFSDKPAVEVLDLSFTYPGGQRALKGVNMRVGRGDFFALLGPNGAGKTTLARNLVGILKPPSGRVFVLGEDVTTLEANRLADRVGYVFQNPEHQFVEDTVYDELAFGLRVRGMKEAEVEERVKELLADFSLETYADRNPFSLSQGQKRKLSVATMQVLEQELLVLDEPTLGQDRSGSKVLMEKLRDLNRRGVTVIIITHDMQIIAEYAQKAAVLCEGELIYQGEVRKLFEEEELLGRCFLTPPPLYRLSRRLRDSIPSFPLLMTMEEYCQAVDSCPKDRDLG